MMAEVGIFARFCELRRKLKMAGTKLTKETGRGEERKELEIKQLRK